MKKNDVPPRKRFDDALLYLGRTQSLATAFEDFLDFALLFVKWWDRRPEEYARLEEKYPTPDARDRFPEAYLAMADLADNRGTGFKDPFGDFYMEHLSNDGTGQFFTPEEVCDMMVLLQMGDDLPDNARVCDPCCGSGRLLLSAAKINRKPNFFAADVDLTCCKMTLLNFLLNTMSGEVAWMNTLSLQHWKSWRVGRVMAGNGVYLPYYQEIEVDKAVFPLMQPTTVRSPGTPLPSSDSTEWRAPPKQATSRGKKGGSSNQLFFDFGE